jgi:NAD(P)-dependent dehydrogenase (short-subunit alcohol dehydrogenase family)
MAFRYDMKEKKVFLITGVSSGFGHAFSEAAIAAGHTVIGTLRRDGDHAAFEALSPDRAHARVLDVTDFEAIESRGTGIVSYRLGGSLDDSK